jgi:putative ABC transport system permease protein
MRALNYLDDLAHDLRFAARGMRRCPGFATAAMLTVALGIGANTGIFSVVRAVLLDPLPYAQPDRLVTLSFTASDRPDQADLDYTMADDWRDHNRSFSGLSGYRDGLGVLVLNGEAEMLRGLRVSWDFFDTLGVKMELGRTFRRDEDAVGNRSAIILSHNFWARRFGADPHIIGRVLQLSDACPTVVGVLPAGFDPLLKATSELTPEMYLPLGLGPGATCCRAVRLIGRLKPGATIGQAQDEITALTRRFAQEQGLPTSTRLTASVVPLGQRLFGRVSTALWATVGSAGLVLLIACVNVANLVLARGGSRAKEMAARAALGASHRRLITQLLTENLVIALGGGLIGILLAFAARRILVSLAPLQILRVQHTRMDTPVLLFGLAISLLTVGGFGLVPTLRLSRVDVNQTLKAGDNARLCRWRRSFPNGLVAAELALAFVLVMGASLMLKTFIRLLHVDLGFEPHKVLTLTTNVWTYTPANGQAGYYQQVLERLRATPGVESAAFASTIPMDQIDRIPLLIQGRPIGDAAQAPLIEVSSVMPDYFHVMRIPLKRGRLFDEHDDSRRVVLISENCARTQFPGEDPIGKHIMLGEIIGVVGDVRLDSLDRAPGMQAYTPFPMSNIARLVARTTGDPYRLEGAIRNAFLSVDKMQPVYHVKSLEDYVSGTIAERSFTLGLLGLFGGLALVLGAIGIHGVISYFVSRQTREIAICLALGAQYRDVLARVLRQGLLATGMGLAIGWVSSLLLNHLLVGLLFEVRPSDGATLAEVSFLLIVIAVLATYLPAQRAARIELTVALRQE